LDRSRALWLLAAAALFLGLWGMGQAYRSDEVWSLRAVAMPWDAMMDELRDDVHPPLYYWLLRGWTKVAGTSEIGTRLLSLLLALLASAAIYRSGREWFGARGALLSAAVFATCPLLIIAEQFTRMYGLLAFASAISTVLYLRVSRAEQVHPTDFALYVLANIAGTLTHVWFFFLLFGQGVAHLALRRFSRLGWMAAAALFSLAPYAFYWLPVLLRQVRKTETALAWATTPGAGDVIGALMLLGWLWWLAIPILWRNRPRHTSNIGLACAIMAIVALATPIALSFWRPIFWPRFTIVALPALALAIGSLAPNTPRVRLEPAFIAIICAVAFIVTGFYATRCDSRSGARFLTEAARPGDLIVFTNISRPAVDHYWRNGEITARSFPAENDAHPGFDGPVPQPQLDSEAAAILDSPGRVIVFHGFRPQKEAVLLDGLERSRKRVDALCRTCEGMGGYYNRISVFEAR